MGDGLGLKLNDLYPNYTMSEDTSTSVIPDADDIEKVSMDETSVARQNTNTKEPNKKMVGVSIIVIVLLVIFFGMD